MKKEDWPFHESHCCILHGCKYGKKDCPVVKKKIKQLYLCEDCENDGIEGIPNPDDLNYDVYEMDKQQLREELIKLRASIMRL